MKIISSATLFAAAVIGSSQAFAPSGPSCTFVQKKEIVYSYYHLKNVPCSNKITKSRSTELKMNLFDRFQRVAKANINSVLKSLEDPEKILNQAVEDMQVRKIRNRI